MDLDRSFRFLPEQASTLAPQIDWLALFLLGITTFFTLLVLVLVTYFALRYRRKSTDFTSPNPPETGTHLVLELTWMFIPLAISMVIFVWGAKLYVDQSTCPEGAMEIHVIGKQWMWKIQHPDGQREIDELTVPVGVPVKLVMTSQDVIHSFYIPAFRIKQDVLPGRYSYQWFQATKPGVYRLYCTEYCGTQHSGMVGAVRVLKDADYQAWLANRPADAVIPADIGREVYDRFQCAKCHGVQAPTLAGLFNQQVQVTIPGDGERTLTADYNYIRESILYPRAKIVKDFPDYLMPSYQGQMSEEQLMALIEYIKSLKSTEAGPARVVPGTRMQEQAPRRPDLSTYQSGNAGTRD